jgi:hypothetical protein
MGYLADMPEAAIIAAYDLPAACHGTNHDESVEPCGLLTPGTRLSQKGIPLDIPDYTESQSI